MGLPVGLGLQPLDHVSRREVLALWRIAMVRMAHDPTTRAYVEPRTKEGLSKPEIIRCLKRYIARQGWRRE